MNELINEIKYDDDLMQTVIDCMIKKACVSGNYDYMSENNLTNAIFLIVKGLIKRDNINIYETSYNGFSATESDARKFAMEFTPERVLRLLLINVIRDKTELENSSKRQVLYSTKNISDNNLSMDELETLLMKMFETNDNIVIAKSLLESSYENPYSEKILYMLSSSYVKRKLREKDLSVITNLDGSNTVFNKYPNEFIKLSTLPQDYNEYLKSISK